MMGRSFLPLLLLLVAAPATAGQADAPLARAVKERKAAIEAAATDASLRSPLAVPKAVFEAEVAEDKKKATAKIGLAWGRDATSEIGFTGAFDKNARTSRLTSLRELTPGSSMWVATTWKKFRERADSLALSTVCRQAAWAQGESAATFDCAEPDLAEQSFAARLEELETSTDRLVCLQFQRAMMTGAEVAAAMDLRSPLCNGPLALSTFTHTYGARYTEPYLARHKAAVAGGDTAAALGLCNEYRRSRRQPPTSDCDPEDFEDADTTQFARSWQERFEDRRENAEAEVCDQYRQARGEVPTGKGGCAPAGADPLFDESFRARLASTYHWAGTPMWGFKAEFSRPGFEFLDEALEAHEETHGVYSVGAHAGWLTANDVLFLLQYSLGESWKAPDATELCRALADTGATTCEADVVLGAPEKTRRRQMELQIKGYLGSSTAASLIVTRDVEKKAWGVEAPIYFMTDKQGGLNGGLVFTYKREKNKSAVYAVSVFVGQVFDVF